MSAGTSHQTSGGGDTVHIAVIVHVELPSVNKLGTCVYNLHYTCPHFEEGVADNLILLLRERRSLGV